MALLDWLLSLFRKPEPPALEVALGVRALLVARGEIGKGEAGANNDGADVIRYRRGRDTNASWCASFVSYCLEEAAAAAGIPCPVKRSAGAKRLFKNAQRAGGTLETEPRAGDLVLWHRGPRGSWKGHIGIVSATHPDGTFHAIEGNRGRYPASVDVFKHQLGEAGLLGFVRL